MPNISKHQSAVTTKTLVIADSGAGKTGALASLADAGYNVRVLDLDNGADVLKNVLMDENSPYKKTAFEHCDFVTITDPMKPSGGKLIPVRASVWTRATEQLADWQDPPKGQPEGGEPRRKLGGIVTWTPQEVLVIDSLTMLSTGALNFILSLNGRLGQKPYQSDWYDAQILVENLLQMLYDEGVKCNVIVNCHITYIGEENGPVRGYPMSLGKALPPKIGRYFNNALMIRSVGQGQNIRRRILTNTSGIVELKNTAPLRVLPEYPIETGLAEFFKAVRGT